MALRGKKRRVGKTLRFSLGDWPIPPQDSKLSRCALNVDPSEEDSSGVSYSILRTQMRCTITMIPIRGVFHNCQCLVLL